MKTKIELLAFAMSLLAFFLARDIALAETAWIESSYRAAAALKGGNLDSAQEYLGKALPEADKMSKDSIESSGRKLDVEALCTTFDTWKHVNSDMQKEKRRLKNLEKKQETKGTDSKIAFRNQMTEMRQNIDEQIKESKQYVQMLETAISLRKKVYLAQDQTTADYQSELHTQLWSADALKNLRSLTDAKTPEEMTKLMTTPSPEGIFASYFASPGGQISELKGGGYAWQGHDVWIRFKSSQPVALQSHNQPSNINPNLSLITQQFLKVCPQDNKLLSDTADLEVSQGKGNQGGEWVLLSNKKQGVYWFRHWGGD